ncbi:MAG: hypothetical protein FH749_05440 [Firmicutes bacterium]|nr:hypothetical protein [Bacillota bacterium]
MQLQVNLLPKQFRPQPSLRPIPVLITIILLINAMALAGWWVLLEVNLGTLRSDLDSLESSIASLERKIADAEWAAELEDSVMAKADYIQMKVVESKLWNPSLTSVEQAMENEVILSGFRGTPDGAIVLSGYTPSITAVANMLGSLHQETGLRVVHYNSATVDGSFQLTLSGWHGREVPEEDE